MLSKDSSILITGGTGSFGRAFVKTVLSQRSFVLLLSNVDQSFPTNNRLVREAIICPIPDGTTEIQKLIISRALTGVGAFR